jgi:hypothetical protein
LFLYWPHWPWQRVNIADWESIRGQYRNNQLITPLLNNSTYVVYTTNIRPAKLVLYWPYQFHRIDSQSAILTRCQGQLANTADLESIPGPIQKQPVNNTIIFTDTKACNCFITSLCMSRWNSKKLPICF